MTDERAGGNGAALDLTAATVSAPRILGAARELRAVSWLLELGLQALLAGSALAAASAFAWADVPLLAAAGLLLVLLGVRAWLALGLRRLLGRRRFSFHPSRLWIVLDQLPAYRMPGWSFDLGRPLLPLGALFWPGLGLLLLVLSQLVLLPPQLVGALTRIHAEDLARDPAAFLPLTVSVEHTRTGALFLAWALGLHLVGAAVLDSAAARRRFQRVLCGFGVLLGLIALAQASSGTALIYGLWAAPGAGGARTVFGPFPNRNHFAAYMLMVVPAALGLLFAAAGRYRRRVGRAARLRRWLVGLQSSDGTRLVFALLPAGVTLAALLASASRGAALAFAAAVVIGALALPARARRLGLLASALVLGLAAVAFGTGALQARFARLPGEAQGRTLVWRDTLSRMDGLWLCGAGLNAFPRAMSRATIYSLPKGATPWREPLETSVAQAPRLGYRALAELPNVFWYGHAHNDYLQVLVETGLGGLALTLLAAVLVVRRAWSEPWRLVGLLGVMFHSFVDFPLHVPPVAALFVVLAAVVPEAQSGSEDTEGAAAPAEPAPA